MTAATAENGLSVAGPDIKVSVRQTFGLDCDMEVPAFSQGNEHVPDIDEAYRFDHNTTLAILAGFAYNRRVMIQGYHGTGKSTHVEQVSARLNWPCIRINLDSHVSRIDLGGQGRHRSASDGKQVTEFREGHPALVTAASGGALLRRVRRWGGPTSCSSFSAFSKSMGRLTLSGPEQGLAAAQVLPPLLATTNTVGLGDTTGLYHGTQQINQGQMDRWNLGGDSQLPGA